jgi:nucleotide-binding universal stress UspA family protein
LGATVHVVGVYGEQRHIDRAQERLAKQGVESEGHLPALQEAGRTLVAFADEQHAQMIVVGNRGMTGAKRALGSVPNYVSHHAHCDVLIVHTT